jgi:hypothetical protein
MEPIEGSLNMDEGDIVGVLGDVVEVGVGGTGATGASGGSLWCRGISRKGLPNRYWRRFVHAVPSQNVSWSDPSLTGYQPLVVGVAGKLSLPLDIDAHPLNALNVASQLGSGRLIAQD